MMSAAATTAGDLAGRQIFSADSTPRPEEFETRTPRHGAGGFICRDPRRLKARVRVRDRGHSAWPRHLLEVQLPGHPSQR